MSSLYTLSMLTTCYFLCGNYTNTYLYVHYIDKEYISTELRLFTICMIIHRCIRPNKLASIEEMDINNLQYQYMDLKLTPFYSLLFFFFFFFTVIT